MRAWILIRDAVLARPGWSVAALLLAVASIAMLAADSSAQAAVVAWGSQEGIRPLLDLVRPFGRGEIAVLIALAVAASGCRRLAGQMLLALILAGALTWALKLGFGRIRPNGDPYSFVSGDTCTAWALVPLIARSSLGTLGAVIVAVGVGLSRIVLGYHWPSDVLGGAAIGVLGAVLAVGIWPARPWGWLLDRRIWLAVAGLAWVGALGWLLADPRNPWLGTFISVWSPAVLGFAVWPWLRRRIATGGTAPAWALPVLAVALGVLLYGLTVGSTLWDRDEPRNALAAREMIANDAWMVPTFNGELRLHKPILPYWLMTAALHTGLPADVATRLPAVLCMTLASLFTALIARRLARGAPTSPDAVALWTMAVMAASPLVLVCGSAATTDATLLLGICATMWVLVCACQDGLRWWHVPVAGIALGWAVLSKGPMGILVPVATLATASVWLAGGRKSGPEPGVSAGAWIVLGCALIIGSALSLAWFLPANNATHGLMYDEMIGDHVIKRSFTARESHGGPFLKSLPFYLPVLVVAFIAWIPAIAVLMRSGGRALLPERRPVVLLLSWALPVFVVITLVQTKLPHYLLPLVPAGAILVALAILGRGHDVWWRRGWRVQMGLGVVVAVALLIVPTLAVLAQASGRLSAPVPLSPMVGLALALGLSIWFAIRAAGGGAATPDRQRWAAAMALGMVVFAVSLAANIQRLEVYKPAPRMAREIQALVPAGVPIATSGFDEPSLYFYLGPDRGPIRNINGGSLLRDWACTAEPGVCVATQQRLDEAAAANGGALPIAVLARSVGFNYSNGKPVELLLVERSTR
jgi:4-amino-4-deoxy-L-arabinose transferase-like glycosyltransferase/membrane-associated phospholipid phosphatase